MFINLVNRKCKAILNQPVGGVVKDIANGAGGDQFDSRVGQIGHSVANGSTQQRYFFGSGLSRC